MSRDSQWAFVPSPDKFLVIPIDELQYPRLTENEPPCCIEHSMPKDIVAVVILKVLLYALFPATANPEFEYVLYPAEINNSV